MLKSAFDHLVVTASSRGAGVAYLTEVLGVVPREGGEHPQRGTHNALIRLGDSTYLEAIAVNPAASRPSRPRWFELDGLTDGAGPRLASWVVRTSDIRRAAARSPLPLGPAEGMTRESLAWQITLPADGRMPLDGVAPSLIEWSTPSHPAALLPESGCELIDLRIRHAQVEVIGALLRAIGFDGPVNLALPSAGQRSGLLARIRTPKGICELGEP